MQRLDRTRIVFIAIIAVALLAVGVLVVASVVRNLVAEEEPTAVPVVQPGRPTPAANLTSPDPIFGPAAEGSGDLPAYVCGADAFGSYFTLQQMQMAGIDVEHGFRLGIVPFLLDDDPAYDISEEQRNALLANGQWDCLLTTLDAVALDSPGVITAIVDESAGADQLWAREIDTINELQGKRITFARNSVGEYFVYYVLSIARLNPRFDVTLVPQDSVADAVAAFNRG
ncbi:MAG: hypothetical protein RRC07_14380, partial [Anaerolineae bacterium]|nr:hypothetical protein [Anaerolineae bacterium]